jgi:hypothetical protein
LLTSRSAQWGVPGTHFDPLLSPAAEVMLHAIKPAALSIYGVRLSGVASATVPSASN